LFTQKVVSKTTVPPIVNVRRQDAASPDRDRTETVKTESTEPPKRKRRKVDVSIPKKSPKSAQQPTVVIDLESDVPPPAPTTLKTHAKIAPSDATAASSKTHAKTVPSGIALATPPKMMSKSETPTAKQQQPIASITQSTSKSAEQSTPKQQTTSPSVPQRTPIATTPTSYDRQKPPKTKHDAPSTTPQSLSKRPDHQRKSVAAAAAATAIATPTIKKTATQSSKSIAIAPPSKTTTPSSATQKNTRPVLAPALSDSDSFEEVSDGGASETSPKRLLPLNVVGNTAPETKVRRERKK
jgi:hypothetical protein